LETVHRGAMWLDLLGDYLKRHSMLWNCRQRNIMGHGQIMADEQQMSVDFISCTIL
jgi:hypothetical protein